mgnify:CR=1 FL=1|jgi:hypothetical protein
MISNPKHGWCDFKIKDNNNIVFFGTPSYTTNVPVDLLQAFLDYKTKGQGMVWFDEEGTEFILVLNPYSIYIISENEYCESRLYDFSELNIDNLIKELIQDIESDLDEWSIFYCGCYGDKTNREHIRNLICQLKEIN